MAKFRILTPAGASFTVQGSGYEYESEALEGLQDRAEILNVALNGEFKDTAAAAVEKFTGSAGLRDDYTLLTVKRV